MLSGTNKYTDGKGIPKDGMKRSNLFWRAFQNHSNNDKGATEHLNTATNIKRNVVVVSGVVYETCNSQQYTSD